MGGTTEPIANALKASYAENADLHDALHIAVGALRAGSPETSNGDQAPLGVTSLEVAILDVNRPRRAFRRISRSNLETLLQGSGAESAGDEKAGDEKAGDEKAGDESGKPD